MAKNTKPKNAKPVAVTRMITMLVRDANGTLSIATDNAPIDCDDNFTAVDTLVQSQKDAGAIMVLVLLDDDSVCKHWTMPEPAPEA